MEQLQRRHEENLAAQRYLAIEAQEWSERQKEAWRRGYALPAAPIPTPPITGQAHPNLAVLPPPVVVVPRRYYY